MQESNHAFRYERLATASRVAGVVGLLLLVLPRGFVSGLLAPFLGGSAASAAVAFFHSFLGVALLLAPGGLSAMFSGAATSIWRKRARATDSRGTVLLLRPIASDIASAPLRSVVNRALDPRFLFDPAMQQREFEQGKVLPVVEHLLEGFGPVVGLGGALSGRLEADWTPDWSQYDQDWQGVVMSALRKCQFCVVVLPVSPSPGILWEIWSTVMTAEFKRKTLYLVPKAYYRPHGKEPAVVSRDLIGILPPGFAPAAVPAAAFAFYVAVDQSIQYLFVDPQERCGSWGEAIGSLSATYAVKDWVATVVKR